MNWRLWLRARLVDQIVERPGLRKAILRRVGSPLLFELYESTTSWHTTAPSLVSELFAMDGADVEQLLGEAREASVDILTRVPRSSLRYPDHFMVEGNTALFLYCVVRHVRPVVALETGVADGFSTALMLAALDRNGTGELHSVDCSSDVGCLVDDRRRWRLHVIDIGDHDAFVALVDDLPSLDLFFHDGGHDYAQQTIEFHTTWRKLRPGGVLLSDDVEWSYAFLDFTRAVDARPLMMMDIRKVVGAAVKDDSAGPWTR